MSKQKRHYLISDHNIHEHYESKTVIHFKTNFSTGQNFEYPEQIRGKMINSGEATNSSPLPALSDVNKVIEKLAASIEQGEIAALENMLKADFYLELGKSFQEDVIHKNTTTEFQANYYTYQICIVRPNLEALLMQNPKSLETLLEKANEYDNKNLTSYGSMRYALLQSLSNIKLADDESINFSDLDLTNASFEDAELGKSNFSNALTQNINFFKSNIAACTITQEQLDDSKTYDKAKIPANYSPYWNQAIKRELSNRFMHLDAYVEKNIPSYDPKYKKAKELFNRYSPILCESRNIPSTEKINMLNDLTSEETKKIFSKHRNLKFLIGEIIAFILLAGVFYLIGAAAMKRKTGHFGLFTQPTSGKLFKGINEYAQKISASAGLFTPKPVTKDLEKEIIKQDTKLPTVPPSNQPQIRISKPVNTRGARLLDSHAKPDTMYPGRSSPYIAENYANPDTMYGRPSR